jgi:hypothetical protein
MHFDAEPDPACHFDADPDPNPACHFDGDPDPDPTFPFDADPDLSIQTKAKKLVKCSNLLIFHTFWLVICKLMRIRIQIQLVTLMRIWIWLITLPFNFDTDPCGSGSQQCFQPFFSQRDRCRV